MSPHGAEALLFPSSNSRHRVGRFELGGFSCRSTNFCKRARFPPESVALMGEVFEDVLQTLGLVDRNDLVAELVAHKIIELVRSGERDRVRLKQLRSRRSRESGRFPRLSTVTWNGSIDTEQDEPGATSARLIYHQKNNAIVPA
jgi:hypothetical protein